MAMRVGGACGLLFLTMGMALAAEAQSLPDYFAASWDVVAAAPLTVISAPAQMAHPVAAMTLDQTRDQRRDLPPIMLAGIPVPPQRPVVTPGPAAYASLAP